MGPPTLHIRLLGDLELRLGGTPLPPLESARAESLLAYLLLHREAPQPRQRLAFLLWPDSTESQARTNLRHVLHHLRHTFPDSDRFLDVGTRTLQWRAAAPYWFDVAVFEEAVSRVGTEDGDGGLAALREAVDVYAGDLLPGSYDEWLIEERERLRQRYRAALERLTALLEARGDQAEAILHAERLLRHDPLREETYRLLMRLYDARGDRARAIRVYHACTATLEHELGVEPSAQTREAYEAVLRPQRGWPDAGPQGGRIGGPPLVGRTRERTQLTSAWRATESGRAQLVLVTGEAGVGKTRLVEEFRSWCERRGAATAVARSYSAEGALAYGPVVAWLRSEALRPRLARLERAHLTELARLLPELLPEVPDPNPTPLSESDRRQRLFDAIARVILATGGPGVPLLLIADDLHWCDGETLQFLHFLLRVEPQARLLVAATARHEEMDKSHPAHKVVAGLHALERCTEVELGRLTRGDTAVLAERLAGHPLGDADVDRLYAETEGNPLFVVEAVRGGWTGGQADRGWITPRVQAVIHSRLAQLSPPAQELVGVAATIGREFTSDALALASEADEDALVGALDELWRRRIIREQGAYAYDFSHDKIREVAYRSMSPAQRRRHHLRVAKALERLHPHDTGPVSGELAAHYERAGAADQAVAWYVRAAEAAQQLHADVEAIRLLERGLDLLRTLPQTADRRVRELAILTALPVPLAAVEGYASARLTTVHRGALDLAHALGVEPAPPLLRSLALQSLSRGEFEAARRFGERLRARGERDADGVLLVEGEYVLGIAAFWQAEFEGARQHFEAAVERYGPEHTHVHLLHYGLDPKVVCLSRLGNTLWFLGLPEEARRARDAALALADQIRHPYSRGVALVFGALLALEMREPERLRELAAALASQRGEDSSPPNHLFAQVLGGYVDVLDGRRTDGVARIQRALDGAGNADHAPGMRGSLLRVLVEACAAAGDARAGLAAAERALDLGGAARIWEAELRRRRAEFLSALGAPAAEVESELARALEVARRQGARSYELRVAASLAGNPSGNASRNAPETVRRLS
jgi:DNA-binding SARP family transcriptional activator